MILAKIHLNISELNTSLSFDILAFNELNKEELMKNILREGVAIYVRKNLDERISDFVNALSRLEEALEKDITDDIIIDGIIQINIK